MLDNIIRVVELLLLSGAFVAMLCIVCKTMVTLMMEFTLAIEKQQKDVKMMVDVFSGIKATEKLGSKLGPAVLQQVQKLNGIATASQEKQGNKPVGPEKVPQTGVVISHG